VTSTQTLLAVAVAVALATGARAQTFVYDAGLTGNPPLAPSPVSQGFQETLTGAATAGPLSPDPAAQWNAWQWNDPGLGLVRYEQSVFSQLPSIYEVELVLRPIAGRLRLEAHAGSLINDNTFHVQVDVVGTDVHLLRPGTTPLVLVDGANGYHSVRLLSGYAWDDALVFFDGVFVGRRAYDSFASSLGVALRFGTEGGPAGRARIHSAYLGPVRSHTWGESYCGPAVPHSAGASARMSLVGSIVLAQNDLTLHATDLPTHTFGYFLASTSAGNTTVGQGTLCLGGGIGRFNGPGQVQSTGPLGELALAIGTQQVPTPTGFTAMQPGQTWHFQCWFRDANPVTTSNLTDGWRLVIP